MSTKIVMPRAMGDLGLYSGVVEVRPSYFMLDNPTFSWFWPSMSI